jgi:hypothetical protein
MALPFEHLERGFDAGPAELAVHPDGVAAKQIARAGGRNGRRAAAEIAMDRRQQRVAQVVPGGIERGGPAAQPDIETRTLSTNSLASIGSPSRSYRTGGRARREACRRGLPVKRRLRSTATKAGRKAANVYPLAGKRSA